MALLCKKRKKKKKKSIYSSETRLIFKVAFNLLVCKAFCGQMFGLFCPDLTIWLCPPQYYEMSYGLNIEMHKQVQILICLPLSPCLFHFLSQLLSFFFPFPLSWLAFDVFGVCACWRVLVCMFKCIWVCVCARVCVFLKCVCVCLFVIDGALSPFPQLGLAAWAQRQDEWLCRLIGAV